MAQEGPEVQESRQPDCPRPIRTYASQAEYLERKLLWRRYLPTKAPLAPDVDLAALAARHELTGATIRLACVEAASVACGRKGTDAVIRQNDLEKAAENQEGKRTSRSVVGFRTATDRGDHRPEVLQLVAKS